ncbi:hypothetical protein F9K78_05140 [Brucella pseudintermedia]|nr:hypothetical protein F9K78_05140 [Brucella pseudintermedia]
MWPGFGSGLFFCAHEPLGSCGFRASAWLYANRSAREQSIRSGVLAPVFLCAMTITAWLRWKTTAGMHFLVAESIKKV